MRHIGDKIAFYKIWHRTAMLKKNSVLVISLVCVLVACGMLAGCGTKGPLYIPEQRYPQAAASKPSGVPKTENRVDQSTSNSQHTGQ